MRTSLFRKVSRGLAACALSTWGLMHTAYAQEPLPPQPQPPPSLEGAGGVRPTSAPANAADVRGGEHVFTIAQQKSRISIIQLQSRVLELPNRITVVKDFNEETLEVTALASNRVLVFAKAPGATSITLVDEFDNAYTVDVFVEADVRELQAYMERLFPGSAIEVIALRDSVVLRGWVTEPDRIPQMIAVAKQFYANVHNQMQVGGVTQVQLHVKVLEVQRSRLQRMGINWLGVGQNFYVHSAPGALAPLTNAAIAPGQIPAPIVGAQGITNSAVQFAVTGTNGFFQAFVDALRTENLAKVLAEPVLVVNSGRPATMLSGGEFPVLVPGSVGTTTIQFREFGVRMEAVPIVLGNGRLRLDIAPEVSERDVQNAVSVNGFVVPGIVTRRVNTQVEMRFGETLMIGGLISRRKVGTTNKLPFFGELPWVGAAFRRTNFEWGETELLILVTPHMAAPMQACQVPFPGIGYNSDDPTDIELYADGMLEVPYYGPDCPDGACPVPGAMPAPGPAPYGAPPLAAPVAAPPVSPEAAAPIPSGEEVIPAPPAANPPTSADAEDPAAQGPALIERTSGSGVSANRSQAIPIGEMTNPFPGRRTDARNTKKTTEKESRSTETRPSSRAMPGLIGPRKGSPP
ncbi:type II and III secretion system protein family protein [Planctomyces sp. SH-PL14]|uniref:type II and III secretion system protein family protein n=1 Tax=Planctomyces sp. SH-PL14 TaxID=1632864 RepID=UPI00078D26E3|nr:pilus assembly protein N-terminal domain-containing protein [Planctomyces sp. SH-PL14]AMV17135.1 Type II secretion system protein D precursor [Planctomyces sp. SH-PL14]